jgi:hypothetical protein
LGFVQSRLAADNSFELPQVEKAEEESVDELQRIDSLASNESISGSGNRDNPSARGRFGRRLHVPESVRVQRKAGDQRFRLPYRRAWKTSRLGMLLYQDFGYFS